MKVSSSYGVEIRKQNICFRKTVDIYREACAYLVRTLDGTWGELSLVKNELRRFNEAEHLVHTTNKNQARFAFDSLFPKMPSYLRRSAIQFALGVLSSYHTRLSMWEEENGKTSADSLSRGKASVNGRPVLQAVNLGINTDAVCTAMKSDGTVLARKFISFPSEKDHLKHVLGRISRFQREHGPVRCRKQWAYAVNLNEELARKTAGAIISFAEEQGVDVIVFEHLDMKGKIHGKRKQRLHMWKKDTVQEICTHQAHRRGMRVSRICPWNTSALAYDGSGKVERDPENHSLCRFRNGKRYNCDLSATYNIGARYFIREILKPLPVTVRSLLEAEVPAAKRRTSCVYVDLLALNSAYCRIIA